VNRIVGVGGYEAVASYAAVRNRTRSRGPDGPLQVAVPGMLWREVVVLVALAVAEGQCLALITRGCIPVPGMGVLNLLPGLGQLGDPGRFEVPTGTNRRNGYDAFRRL